MGDLPDKTPRLQKMECGCEEDALLVYYPKGINHVTYTLYGETVEVEEIPGYKCNRCGLVMFLPQVGDELFARIQRERALLGLEN